MIAIQQIFLLIIIITFISIIITYYIDLKFFDKNEFASIKDYILNYSSSLINSRSKNPKWICVTTINNPTKQLDKLADEKEFRLVVVADLKTDKTWSHTKESVFLSVNTQKDLNYSIFQTIPFNSYTRKNIGYLYAIQNGARFIYDTDDDNEPIMNLIDYFDFGDYKQELEYDLNSPLVINPYAHFGQPTIWPRGFPLSEINKKLYNTYYSILRPTSIIQQSVVNGDPDVDAIFRLTKTLDYKRIDIKFDDSSPSVRIPLFKITPFNSQNTLYHYKAFWALYLPSTVSFRLTDIWRSYWSQRLMWLLDSTVSFLGPNAYQLRNSHSYLSDYKQEKEMYLKTEDLIKFLYNWKCQFKKFYLCVIDLSEKMAENNFWEKKEVESIKNWLKDLDSIKYVEPTITNFNYETNQMNAIKMISYRNGFKVRYTPRFETLIDIDNFYGNGEKKMKYLEKLQTINYLNIYCLPNKLNYNTERVMSKSMIEQQDITLLITFNHEPILNNIIFLKEFHKSYFKNIVFCGLDITLKIKTSEKHLKKFDSYSFIDYDTREGTLHYHCMSRLIDINYRNTNGILLISDDVLLKHWNLNGSHNSVWYSSKPICDMDLNSNNEYWIRRHGGAVALNRTYNLIEGIASGTINSDQETFKSVKKFLKQFNLNLNSNSTKLKKVCKTASDIFYVPKSAFTQFNILSRMFSSNNVFLEFAVSAILLGLDASFEVLDGKYFWKPIKFDIGIHYFNQSHYVHPFKLSLHDTFSKRKAVCKTYIADKFRYF